MNHRWSTQRHHVNTVFIEQNFIEEVIDAVASKYDVFTPFFYHQTITIHDKRVVTHSSIRILFATTAPKVRLIQIATTIDCTKYLLIKSGLQRACLEK